MITKLRQSVIWFLATSCNRSKNIKTENSISLIGDIVVGKTYSILVGDIELFVVAEDGDTVTTILQKLKVDIDYILTDFISVLADNKISIYNKTGEYFSLSSSDFVVENISGTIVLQSFGNVMDCLANIKPDTYPVIVFSESLKTTSSKNTRIYASTNDNYVYYTDSSISIDVFDNVDAEDIAYYMQEACNFEDIRLTMRIKGVSITVLDSSITNLSATLGGGSESRANFILNFCFAEKRENKDINGTINTSGISTVEIDGNFN